MYDPRFFLSFSFFGSFFLFTEEIKGNKSARFLHSIYPNKNH